MSTFSEALFPLEVSAWAVGGRGKNVTVIQTAGGDEFRNTLWSQALGEWDIQDAFRSTNPNATYSVAALRKFLAASNFGVDGFRFRDPQDNTDEGGGVFDMVDSTHFQMVKVYSITSLSYRQTIKKPVNPVMVTGGTVSSIAYTTGIVTMSSGTPTAWTGSFDIPARFSSTFPTIGLDASTGALFDWQQIKIVEWRNYA